MVDAWNASALPFHCGRSKWFLGEYRHADVVANRAQHLVGSSGGAGSPIFKQRAAWFSSSYNLN